MNFEETMSKLEEIVKKLDSNEVTLDESIKLFEDGIKLAKKCQSMLDEAEKKVNVLITDGEDNIEKIPIEEE